MQTSTKSPGFANECAAAELGLAEVLLHADWLSQYDIISKSSSSSLSSSVLVFSISVCLWQIMESCSCNQLLTTYMAYNLILCKDWQTNLHYRKHNLTQINLTLMRGGGQGGCNIKVRTVESAVSRHISPVWGCEVCPESSVSPYSLRHFFFAHLPEPLLPSTKTTCDVAVCLLLGQNNQNKS